MIHAASPSASRSSASSSASASAEERKRVAAFPIALVYSRAAGLERVLGDVGHGSRETSPRSHAQLAIRTGLQPAYRAADPTSVHLLPQYDAFIIGFRPRESLVPEPVKERIRQDPKGRWETVTGMSPLLVDGIVIGLWRRTKSRTGTRIDVEQVLPLPRGRSRELKAAVERVQEIAS